MRFTTKMLLVPEEVYKALVSSASSKQSIKISNARDEDITGDSDRHLVIESRKKMRKIGKTKNSNPDERQINLIQEFKRYKKFKDDLDQKPRKVHLDNMEDLIEAEKQGENDLAKRSILKRQLSEYLEPHRMENWVDDPVDEDEEEEAEEERDNPQNLNKYPRKKLPSPNKIQLRNRIKPSNKARPYPEIANEPIARKQIFSVWKENNKFKDANNFITPKAFRPRLWQT